MAEQNAINLPKASQSEAEAGSVSTRVMTPLRSAQAIAKQALNKEFLDLGYYWGANIKQMATADSTEGWVSGAWGNATGTYSADTTNFRTNGSAVKGTTVATNNNGGISLVTSLDLTKFNDKSTSSTADYICFSLYLTSGNYTSLGSGGIAILISNDSIGTFTNYFNFATAKASLTSGWNFIAIAKSAFTSFGTASWASITGFAVYESNASSSGTAFTVENIQLIRKNPSSSAPQPFQRRLDGAWTNEFTEFGGGKITVVMDYTHLCAKCMLDSNTWLYSTNHSGADWVMNSKMTVENSTGHGTALPSLIDTASTTAVTVWVLSNSFEIIEYSASYTSVQTVAKSFSVAFGDVLDVTVKKTGDYISATLYKNGDLDNPTIISLTFSTLSGTASFSPAIWVGDSEDRCESFGAGTKQEFIATAGFASRSKSVNMKQKAGAFSTNELNYGEFGVDTTNNALYAKGSSGLLNFSSGVSANPSLLPVGGTPSTVFPYAWYTDSSIYSVQTFGGKTAFQLNATLGIGESGSGAGGIVYRNGVEQFLGTLTTIDGAATSVAAVIIQGGYIYLTLNAGSQKVYRCLVTDSITTGGNWTLMTISGTAINGGLVGYGNGKFWNAGGGAYTPYTLSGTTLTSGIAVTVTGASYSPDYARINDNGIYADFSSHPKVRFADFSGTLDTNKQSTIGYLLPLSLQSALYVGSNNTDHAGGIGRNVLFKIYF